MHEKVDSFISYFVGAIAMILPFLLQLAQVAQILASFIGLAVVILRFRHDLEKYRRLRSEDFDE